MYQEVSGVRELIRADWYRARKTSLYRLLLIEAAAVVIMILLATDGRGLSDRLELKPDVPGVYLLITAMVMAVVYGVSNEQDYAGGTIRNKLVTGHSRASAYWASYAVNTIIAYLVALVYLALMLGTGLVWTRFDFGSMAAYLAQGAAGVAAFTALYGLIGVIWTRRGNTVVCLITVLVLVFISNQIVNALAEPEFYDEEAVFFMQMEGEVVQGTGPVPNPYFISYPERSVYEFFNCFLPSGQSVQMIEGVESQYLPLYAAGFCAICWVLSLLILKRRNLK